jgi:signal peptidase I
MFWTRARARQAPSSSGPDLHGLGSRAPGGFGSRSRRCLRGRSLVHLGLVLVLSVGSYFFCSRFVYTTVEIRGLSMYPNLVPGDRFLLNLWRHVFQAPRRGELVVIRDPVHGDFAVKRVVGLPGETIQMRRNIAYVDGHRLVEPYLPASALASEDALMERGLVVPESGYFVLGDNRDNSEDSRRYGAVPRRNVFGTIRLAGQLESFLRPVSGAALDQSSPLPLPRIPVAASERKERAGP